MEREMFAWVNFYCDESAYIWSSILEHKEETVSLGTRARLHLLYVYSFADVTILVL
jgi:hypothetical protein